MVSLLKVIVSEHNFCKVVIFTGFGKLVTYVIYRISTFCHENVFKIIFGQIISEGNGLCEVDVYCADEGWELEFNTMWSRAGWGGGVDGGLHLQCIKAK